jgi:hypothetical protein
VSHPEYAVRSGSVGFPDRQQLLREKTLFLYSQALERGDLDLVGTVLHQAETDEVLEYMILDLSKSIETDYFGPQAHVHSSAGGMLGWILDPSLSTSRVAKAVEEKRVPMNGQNSEDDCRSMSEIENRTDKLYRLALDHLEALRYLDAEQCLSQALDLALFIDDPLAVAECAFLFAEIEECLAHDAYARAFWRLGLSMLDVGVPPTARQSTWYDSSTQSPLMSFG